MAEWLQKINEAIASRIARGRVDVFASKAGIHLYGEVRSTLPAKVIPWKDVRTIIVDAKSGVEREVMVLTIEYDGGAVVIDESMTGWQGFVEALASRLTGAVPYAGWRKEFLAQGGERSPITVFDRATFHRLGLTESEET